MPTAAKTSRRDNAQTAGGAAFLVGKSLVECPHSGVLGIFWRLGWHSAAKAA